MTQQTVGLIGGVGPGSTAVFYQAVVRRYAARHGGDQPPLLIYSIPMAASIEAAILGGATAGPEVERLVGLLETGVRALARAGVDAISMPCNTLQGYLPPIVERAGLPYIPLIGATAEHIQRAGYRRAALVCTSAMRSLGLYQAALEAQGVACLLPAESEQEAISAAIADSIHGRPDPNTCLGPVLRRLETAADSILLGCSDLNGFSEPGFTRLPVVDAMDVLAEATVDYLLS